MPEPSVPANRSVVILGAGLTGMAAADALNEAGVDHWLVERDSRVGGLATTQAEAGYRFDRTGHLLHLRNPLRRERVLTLLDEPPLSIERRSFVYSDGVFTRYPYQSNTFGLPPAVAFACVRDFVYARMNPATAAPKNFEDFCRYHFGNAIAERFMLPYNRRLFGVEPRDITTTWCDRFVPIPSVEDVLAGAIGYEPAELGYNVTGLYPKRGIGELTDAMGRRLRSLSLRREPRQIDVLNRLVHFDDGSCRFQHLISTIPLDSLLRMIPRLPLEVNLAARALRCAPLYYLDVALRRKVPKFMHWVYVPEERFPFYRVGNYAAFSESMAPHGAACLYVELVDRREPCLQQLWPLVESGLVEMGIIRGADDVVFCRVRRIDHAYVIYDTARDAALSTINQYLATANIVTTGRYGGWNYSSMEDALEFGEQAAASALKELS